MDFFTFKTNLLSASSFLTAILGVGSEQAIEAPAFRRKYS
jgi:hypothetical protein